MASRFLSGNSKGKKEDAAPLVQDRGEIDMRGYRSNQPPAQPVGCIAWLGTLSPNALAIIELFSSTSIFQGILAAG